MRRIWISRSEPDQSPYDPGIEWEALYADPIECAIVPTSHSLASAAVVTTEQLKTEVLWLMPAGSLPPIMQRIADALQWVGITQWEEHESIESLFTLVAAGRGWTVPRGLELRHLRALIATTEEESLSRIDVGIADAYPGSVDDPAITAVRLLEDTLECALFASIHPLAGPTWVTALDLAG